MTDATIPDLRFRVLPRPAGDRCPPTVEFGGTATLHDVLVALSIVPAAAARLRLGAAGAEPVAVLASWSDRLLVELAHAEFLDALTGHLEASPEKPFELFLIGQGNWSDLLDPTAAGFRDGSQAQPQSPPESATDGDLSAEDSWLPVTLGPARPTPSPRAGRSASAGEALGGDRRRLMRKAGPVASDGDDMDDDADALEQPKADAAPAASVPASWGQSRGPAPARGVSVGSRSLPPTPAVTRQATVRYFSLMNPQRMYPLVVMLSEREIRRIVRRHVEQTRGEDFETTVGEELTVEPVLPGCDCWPPRAPLTVTDDRSLTTFWVVPRVLGEVMQARVTVRRGNQVVSEVPLKVRVRRQRWAVLAAACGVLAPIGTALLQSFGVDPQTQAEQDFGLYVTVLQWLAGYLTPDRVLLALLVLAGVLYLWARPRRRTALWDVEPR